MNVSSRVTWKFMYYLILLVKFVESFKVELRLYRFGYLEDLPTIHKDFIRIQIQKYHCGLIYTNIQILIFSPKLKDIAHRF